jgi:hypothetical protein
MEREREREGEIQNHRATNIIVVIIVTHSEPSTQPYPASSLKQRTGAKSNLHRRFGAPGPFRYRARLSQCYRPPTYRRCGLRDYFTTDKHEQEGVGILA